MTRKLRLFLFVLHRIHGQESNQGQRGKRLLAMAAWQLYRRISRRPIRVTLFNGLFFKAYGDCHISSNVIYFRIPACREMGLLRKLIHGGELIDIGANVGLFTLMLADQIDHAILFEPNGLAVRRALENMALNRLPFEVQPLALSEEKGEIYFEERGGVDTQNRVVSNPAGSPFCVHRIPCDTLDHFLEDRRMVPAGISLIKIDVEGHENSVLRGMQRTLIRRKPRAIMFEYLTCMDFLETRMLLEQTGYKIYRLDDEGRLRTASSPPRSNQNLFAFPENLSLGY